MDLNLGSSESKRWAVAPKPANEQQRLQTLRRGGILDTLPEQAYDDIVYLAARICDTPIALISLVDAERQWFKARVGLEAAQTPRDVAFCAHAILGDGVFEVSDTHADERFAANPLVTGTPHARFYAGAPLVATGGDVLGTVCVIDRRPKELNGAQREALAALSRLTVTLVERSAEARRR